MKLLFLIVPKNLSEQASNILSNKKIDFQTVVPAVGTAPNELLEYLSLGDGERSLFFSIVDDSDVSVIFEELKDELEFLKSGKGVAFTVEIDAATKLGYLFLYNQLDTFGGNH